AVLRALASHTRGRAEKLDSFRIAVVGSDVWTGAEIEEFRAIFGPGTRLANSYGVTEATIDSTCWFLDESREAPGQPPIGFPLTHTTVWVLDEGLGPVPPGITGDLYLGGPAVGRGYLDRPDLTADRFVPDPFDRPGSRLYRTGDRARYLADGRIAFAGRADDQLKIRGQRVEPAEIESAIAALPRIATCAVVAKRDPQGIPRLAAYLVLRDGEPADVGEIRRLLRDTLPEVMIPQAFRALNAMPLTPNGKVDRRRLPEPDWIAESSHEAPRTGIEKAIAGAYGEVLGIGTVGATDDFFGLGGHSLLATRVVSRLRASLGVELPLRAIFEAPVVRDLAARAERLAGSRVPPPVRRAPPADRLRLSYSQRRLWFLDRLEPGMPWYNLPSSVSLRGELDASALERSLAEVVRRHEALRTRFVEGPDGPEQIVDPSSAFSLPVDDLSRLSDADRATECARLTRENACAPFDLAAGPLIRARLLRLEPGDHRLLVTMHHISADGWSSGVLVRELGALYESFARGAASPLPELEVQYADWAAWQRAWLEGGEMDRQLAFWRRELEGIETLTLAADRPRPTRPTYAGAPFGVRLGRTLTDRVARLAREEGATLHIALLAAYAQSLGRLSGQRNFAIGVPVANRRAAEVEDLIGFFVNTLPVRVRLGDGVSTFRDLLRTTRDAALGSY
ncbi:MAG TPA: condensation domain-containing protein, partial [Verrucomicrobiae bacterium]|nr:condensation domain-containing protein [Verrucomicrobiae bacterium]